MWDSFFSALALVFVLEGLLPFASPKKWKQMLFRVIQCDDRVLRLAGFISMIVGVVLLTLMHQILE
ncbi:MAG: DUF2065 domain-containing protein [Legionellaceae bacterium]|nr:DUF2065 domain-containing protein [Legionellaceae bacterium]